MKYYERYTKRENSFQWQDLIEARCQVKTHLCFGTFSWLLSRVHALWHIFKPEKTYAGNTSFSKVGSKINLLLIFYADRLYIGSALTVISLNLNIFWKNAWDRIYISRYPQQRRFLLTDLYRTSIFFEIASTT